MKCPRNGPNNDVLVSIASARASAGDRGEFVDGPIQPGHAELSVFSTAVDWATEASSPHARYIRLRDVARLARFLHAEDPNHEVPTNSFCTSTRPFGRLRRASRTDGYSQHASRMSTRLLVQNL